MEWSDEGVVLTVRPHGEVGGGARALHAPAWPASGAGARRALAQAAPRPADRQPRRCRLEGAARRQPRTLLGGAAQGLRGAADGGRRRTHGADVDGGAGAAAARARSAPQPVRGHPVRAGLPRRPGGVAGARWCAGSWHCWRSWGSASILPPARPPARAATSSTFRPSRAAPCRRTPASPTRTGCSRCPSSCAPEASAPVAADDVLAGFALTGHFLNARVLAPRDLELPDARNRLLTYLRRP